MEAWGLGGCVPGVLRGYIRRASRASATMEERERKASRSRTWRRTMVDIGCGGGESECGVWTWHVNLPRSSPRPAPHSTERGNRTGSVVPSRCLSCPLSFRLSSVKSSCSTQTYLARCAQLTLCARRPFAIAMSTRSENNHLRELSLSGLGRRQRGVRKSRWPASSWSR